MINSPNAPRTQRWFDLITIGVGFIAILVLMLLLAPVFTGNIKVSAPLSLRH